MNKKAVGQTLRNALGHPPTGHPYRGPANYVEGPDVYENHWEGTIEEFSGEETVVEQHSSFARAYFGKYMGGLIDLHPDE